MLLHIFGNKQLLERFFTRKDFQVILLIFSKNYVQYAE